MDLEIRGKTAMIAAASKGIGLAVAKCLAKEDVKISICGRNEETLEAASEAIDGDVRTYVCDVTSPDDLKWWFEETNKDLGPVDILVTNTGGPPAGVWTELTDEQWETGIQSTLMNVIRMTRLCYPSMIERKWGRIIHITSLVAREPNRILPISSTLRAGLMSMTTLQSQELAKHGITVNAVLPGHTLTDRQIHLAEIRAKERDINLDQALALQASEIPAQRLAEPEEIGDAVAFLASKRASFISGVSLLVDGGQTHSPF